MFPLIVGVDHDQLSAYNLPSKTLASKDNEQFEDFLGGKYIV